MNGRGKKGLVAEIIQAGKVLKGLAGEKKKVLAGGSIERGLD